MSEKTEDIVFELEPMFTDSKASNRKSSIVSKDAEHLLEKLPYPKSVFFIVSNEFCERFSFYGMKTILSIYLLDMLLYSESETKIIYHTFSMFVYFFPLFGAMLADSLLGKFRTIFYISIIYAIGNIVLALAATPVINLPAKEISIVGLLLIALGTGGIKPCVSAFGGDQFELPQQELQLAKFFSMFYFAINAGSLISSFVTPLLRERPCLDSDECYTLAFGVPGVLMVVSIIIFGLGRKLYKIRTPEGNMVIKVSKTIWNAIREKSRSKTKSKEHWLDYAEPKYGRKLVSEVKAVLKVLVLYIPLPVFWALFDQQGTGWTFQAKRMDGDIGFYTILPDQMQVINPLLILLFIPLFEYVFYPFMNKLKILRTPLQRLVAGGVLVAVAFAMSAVVSLYIEAEAPVLPTAGNGQLRIYNNLDCSMTFKTNMTSKDLEIKSMEFGSFEITLQNNQTLGYTTSGACIDKEGTLQISEKQSIGYYYMKKSEAPIRLLDSISKDDKGLPKIRTVVYGATKFMDVVYKDDDGSNVIKTNTTDDPLNNSSEHYLTTKPATCKVHIGDFISEEITFKLGGVYTVLINLDEKDIKNSKIKLHEVTEHNSMHMLLLTPQYVVLTMAEIMFSITGLEFSYSQSPNSMKSVLQACWLLTTAFGNLIVVIIESAEIFEEQSYNFFFYAGLMLVDMAIFALMAMRYKYVEKDAFASDSMDLDENEKEGLENPVFSSKGNRELDS